MAAKPDQKRYISSEELQKHNSPSDLWISIHGKIYNVTDWINNHPGGDLPLFSFSGQDATDAFLAFHPPSAWNKLEHFFSGYYLSDYNISEVSKDYRLLVSEFTNLGLYQRKGHCAIFTILSMVVLFPLVVFLITNINSCWAHLVAGGLLGIIWIQSGWIGHDSGHYNVMITPYFNRLAQILSGNCLTGISIAWWKRNHNAHHMACNSLEFDPDLQHMPVFAVSSKLFNSLNSYFYDRTMGFDLFSRFMVSYQHLSFYPVMCIARLNLFAQSIILLLSKKKVSSRWHEIVGVTVFWTWYPFLISFLPNWEERLMFVIASFVVTGIQHVQFCLNHFSSAVYVGNPKGNDWFEKQTSGTLNITSPPWMDWFHGGLEFQVEHHLFPRLPRCNLRRIAPVVKELCKKHGLEYSCIGFIEANIATLRTLRIAALQARNVECAVPKNLLWEAVNTHG